MALSTLDLVEGHFYEGGYSYRLLITIDGKDVEYRHCYIDRAHGGIEFREIQQCLKSTFCKWGDKDITRSQEKGFSMRDIDLILSISDPVVVGHSRGETGPSKRARLLSDIGRAFAEGIRDQCRADIEHYYNKLQEALTELKAWQETYDAWMEGDNEELEFPNSKALIEELEKVEGI